MTTSAQTPSRVRAARRLLGVGATLTALGIVMNLGTSSQAWSALTVLGIALTIGGLHRVGRLGPDDGALRSRS